MTFKTQLLAKLHWKMVSQAKYHKDQEIKRLSNISSNLAA